MKNFFYQLFFLFIGFFVIKGVYLPGVAPHEFQPGDKVKLYINSLVSPSTLKPLDFHNLPLCTNDTNPVSLNLGRRISGSTLYQSNYQIITGHNTAGCKVLCIRDYTKKEIQELSKLITQKYQINW
jgi:transmembrane 9 superfamily member 2/4